MMAPKNLVIGLEEKNCSSKHETNLEPEPVKTRQRTKYGDSDRGKLNYSQCAATDGQYADSNADCTASNCHCAVSGGQCATSNADCASSNGHSEATNGHFAASVCQCPAFNADCAASSGQCEASNGSLSNAQCAASNGDGFQTEMMPCSPSAEKGQEAPYSSGNENSDKTIDLNFMFTVLSEVCSVSQDNFLLIVEDLRGKRKPINYETLLGECETYNGFYAPDISAPSCDDDFEDTKGASSISSNLSSTHSFQSPPSSVHASEISPSLSHHHHLMNSVAKNSLSTSADNSNAENTQSYNSEYPILSLPTIAHDLREFTHSVLHEMTENVGEDSTDGRNLESNDGLDRWLASDLSNPQVEISDSNFENMISSMFSQTSPGLEHSMSGNKELQNRSLNELSHGKTSEQVPMVQPNSAPAFSGVTAGRSSAVELSSKLNTADDSSNELNNVADGLTVSPNLQDIECDGAQRSRQTDGPRNIQSAESKPVKELRILTQAERNQISFSLLETEHELLEKSRLCHGCRQKPREVTFLPCGHFITCADCAEPMYECPLCQKSILATVNTYLS